MKEQIQKAFEAWWDGRQLPENFKAAFFMVWQAALDSSEAKLAAVPAQEPIAYKVVVTLNGEITRSTFEPRKMLEANKKFITDNGYEVVETPLFAQQPAQEPATNLFEIVTHGESGDAWLLLRADAQNGLGHHCVKFEGTAADDLRKRFKLANSFKQQPAQEPVKQESKPEYTFDELTKLVMQAATKEGHKVTIKIKWAQTPVEVKE